METGDTVECQPPQQRRKRNSNNGKNSKKSKEILKDLQRKSREELLDVVTFLQKAIDKLKDELAGSVKEKEELQKVMEKYDSKLARLKAEIYRLQDEIEDKEGENEELRTTLKKFKNKLKVGGSKEDVSDQTEHEGDSGHSHDCEKHKASCGGDRAKEQTSEDDSELQRVIEDMTEQCEMQENKIEELEDDLEERDSTIEKLNKEIEELQKENKERNESKEQDTDVDELKYSVTELEDQIEQMSTEKQKMHRRIQELETFIAEQDLELPVDDIEGVSPRSANSALRILKTQYLRLMNEHTNVTKEKEHLQEEMELLRKEFSRNYSSDEESKASSTDEYQSDRNEQNFIGHHNSMEKLNSDDGPYQSREKSTSQTEVVRTNYEKQLAELQKELEKSRKEVDDFIILKNEMLLEKDQLMQYINMIKMTNTDLDQKNKVLNQNLEASSREKMELAQRLQCLRTENQNRKEPNKGPTPAGPEQKRTPISRVTASVRDLVKFHENQLKDPSTEKAETNSSWQKQRPRLEPWPCRSVSADGKNILVGNKPPGQENKRIQIRNRQGGPNVRRSRDYTEARGDVGSKDARARDSRECVCQTKSYVSDENVWNALSALKVSAEEIDTENEDLHREIFTIKQKYEWQLNFARLQQERSALLYNALHDEHQKLVSTIQEKNSAGYLLSCYYKELVNEIEFEKEQLHAENAQLKNQFKDFQKEIAKEVENEKEQLLGQNAQLKNQFKDFQKELVKKLKHEREQLIAENVQLKNQFIDFQSDAIKEVEELGQTIENVNAEKAAIETEYKKKLLENESQMKDVLSVNDKLRYRVENLTKTVREQEDELSDLDIELDRIKVQNVKSLGKRETEKKEKSKPKDNAKRHPAKKESKHFSRIPARFLPHK